MRRIGARLSLVIGLAVIAALAAAACGGGEPTPPLPPKSDPAAFTQAFVQRAIDYYEDKGLDETVDFYNTLESVDGQWYVFIADGNDVMLAHAAVPENVGKHADDIRGAGGYPAGNQVAAAATEGGAWTDYTYLNPNSGSFESKHTWVIRHDGLVFGSGWYEPGPSKDDPPAYTQAIVQQAINLYDALGLDETAAYYNSPESVDGPWYVTLYDENDVMVAHATVPENVGLRLEEVRGADGFPIGRQVAATAVEDGAWVDYTYLNPSSGIVETKHAWTIRHDGLLFGSGWYEPGPPKDDPAAYTQALVQQAINLYDAVGLDETVDFYNSPESVDGQWYVFIADEHDVMLAHATIPENVGLHADDIRGAGGFPAGNQVAAAATEGGAWTDYTYLNPNSGSFESKHTWVIRHDGLVFGSGWYEPGPSKDDPPAYTQELVRQAINLYDAVGRQQTVDYYNSADSVDGPWYVAIYDEDTNTIAHPLRKDFLGTSPRDRTDINGKPYGLEVVGATEEGRWVNYVFVNPQTGETQQKNTWVIKHDGLLFLSGWYEPGTSQSDPAAYTKSVVEQAIRLYDAVGREEAVAFYNSAESVNGPWYVAIYDEDTNTIAHPLRKDFLGVSPRERTDANGKPYGLEIVAADENGRWVDYVFVNPETGETEQKHTWVIKYDGLLFLSGWYEPAG